MDLQERTLAGQFREDLYYRLGVYPLDLPPLRQREEDIILLTHHFIQQEARRGGIRPPILSEAAVTGLLNHPWPGNVRELQNAISRSVLLAKDGLIEYRHLGLDRSTARPFALPSPVPYAIAPGIAGSVSNHGKPGKKPHRNRPRPDRRQDLRSGRRSDPAGHEADHPAEPYQETGHQQARFFKESGRIKEQPHLNNRAF